MPLVSLGQSKIDTTEWYNNVLEVSTNIDSIKQYNQDMLRILEEIKVNRDAKKPD